MERNGPLRRMKWGTVRSLAGGDRRRGFGGDRSSARPVDVSWGGGDSLRAMKLANRLIVSLLALPLYCPLVAAPQPEGCSSGCQGFGGSPPPVSVPTCGSVGISVIVLPGLCAGNYHNPSSPCAQVAKCSVTITRTWSGVTPNSDLLMCVKDEGSGIERCQHPPPSSGNGAGSNTNTWSLSCGDGFTWSFTAPCSVATLSVSQGGSCTEC